MQEDPDGGGLPAGLPEGSWQGVSAAHPQMPASEGAWDGAKSVQARVQDIEAHSRQQAAKKQGTQPPAPNALGKQGVAKLPAAAPQHPGSANNAGHAALNAPKAAFTHSAHSVATLMDDTAEMNVLTPGTASSAAGPTPWGTMNAEAGEEASAAVDMQAAARQARAATQMPQQPGQEPWGIPGLSAATCVPNDSRLIPHQLSDTLDTMTAPAASAALARPAAKPAVGRDETDRPNAAAMNDPAAKATMPSADAPLDVTLDTLSDSYAGPRTPMGTLNSLSDSLAGPATPMGTLDTLSETRDSSRTPMGMLASMSTNLGGPGAATPMGTLASMSEHMAGPIVGSLQGNLANVSDPDAAVNPAAMPINLDDTAFLKASFSLRARPDGVVSDYWAVPPTPMGTLVTRAERPEETEYWTGEHPAVRFEEGEDLVIADRTRTTNEFAATAPVPHVARSPRQSRAWQTQMGTVAGWQALAQEVMFAPAVSAFM